MDKGGDISPIGFAHAQKLPVGFVSSSSLVVRDKGGDHRDGEDGDFPSPRGFSPSLLWIGLCFVLRTFALWWGSSVRGMRLRLWLS